MNKKFKLHLWLQWGALALIGLLVAGVSAFAYLGDAPKVVVEGDYIEATSLEQPTAEESEESKVLGGSSVIGTSWQTINGVTTYTLHTSMKSATTTLCSFVNPFGSATSTLESFDWQINTGTSTAASLVIGTSTLQYATSTTQNSIMSAFTVASGATDNKSIVGLVEKNIIQPNNYIQLSTQGAGLSGYTYSGSCTAKVRQMSF